MEEKDVRTIADLIRRAKENLPDKIYLRQKAGKGFAERTYSEL